MQTNAYCIIDRAAWLAQKTGHQNCLPHEQLQWVPWNIYKMPESSDVATVAIGCWEKLHQRKANEGNFSFCVSVFHVSVYYILLFCLGRASIL